MILHIFFVYQMRVMSHQKTALLYMNSGLVAEIHPHFPATRRWGGALNGHQYDALAFRNYKMTVI